MATTKTEILREARNLRVSRIRPFLDAAWKAIAAKKAALVPGSPAYCELSRCEMELVRDADRLTTGRDAALAALERKYGIPED
jgi:hypothetical protein